MKIPMYFFKKINSKDYQIIECYRIRVVEREWIVRLDVFKDVLNPTESELFMHYSLHGDLPPAELLKELLSRI